MTLLGWLTSFLALGSVSSFAISSSKSSGKRVVSNERKGAGGFGQRKDLAPVAHTPDTSAEMANLVSFLLSQGSVGLGMPESTEVGFSTKSNVRGLYATKSYKKGEIICKIPSDCALALGNPGLGGADTPTIAHGGRNFLDFYVNNPKNNQIFAPYLNTLPSKEQHFDPTPDFYSDDETQALEFPRIINKALERRSEIKSLSEAENISFEDLQFATWLVSSRSFQIQMSVDEGPVPEGTVSKPSRSIRVLVPYIDMINHNSDNPNAELHLIDPEKDDAWFAIRAKHPIKENKEITISYGSGVDSSIEILLNYGFVPVENKFDSWILKKGGEDVIESLDGWKTTLEEDEKMLAEEDLNGNMRNVLSLRAKLKRSYA